MKRRMEPIRGIEERNRILAENWKAPYYVVRKTMPQWQHLCSEDDMLTVAMLIAVRCAELWDESRGARFITYFIASYMRCFLDRAEKATRRTKNHNMVLLDPAVLDRAKHSRHEQPDFLEVEKLRRCIAELPPRHRAVVEARMRGEEFLDISKRIGVKGRHSENLYRAATSMLRRMLS